MSNYNKRALDVEYIKSRYDYDPVSGMLALKASGKALNAYCVRLGGEHPTTTRARVCFAMAYGFDPTTRVFVKDGNRANTAAANLSLKGKKRKRVIQQLPFWLLEGAPL